MPDCTRFRGTWMPGRFAVALARRSGVKDYHYMAFYHEWAAAREMLGNGDPTVYHTLYGDDSFRYLGRMRPRSSAKLVATFHLPPERLEEELNSVSHLATLDAVIAVGSNQMSYFRRYVEPERIHIVPHGVDTVVFRPAEESAHRPRSERRCLFVGMHDRDFVTLAEAIDLVGSQEPDVAFDVVTSRDKAAVLANKPNVTFYSGIDEASLISLYQRADLLFQPMLKCTANNAILEGMACGLPVVASDVGAVRDYVSDECAVLVRRGDAEILATALLAILRDDGRRRQMAANARRQALRFEWDSIAARMRIIYEQLFA